MIGNLDKYSFVNKNKQLAYMLFAGIPVPSEIYPAKKLYAMLSILKIRIPEPNLWFYTSVLLFITLIICLFSYKKYLSFNGKRKQLIKEAKDDIIKERNYLRYLIDNLPDRIYIKDNQSRFIIGNQKLADSFGVETPEEVIGKSDHDFFPKELADIFYSDEQEILDTGNPILNKEEVLEAKDGTRKYTKTSKFPLKDEKGNITGIIGIGTDITKLKLAEIELIENANNLREANVLLEEKSEEIQQQSYEIVKQRDKLQIEHNQLRTLIDTMPDVIYFKDKEARFILANKMLSNIMVGGKVEELIGKTDKDFYEAPLAELFYEDDMEVIRTGNPIINKEEEGLDESGQARIMSTTKVPLKDKDGQVIGLIGIGREITKQKDVEKLLMEQAEDLKEINTLLEERQEEIKQQSEELSAQAENLKEANEKLESLIKTKNKFFSIIAHDLKNPFHAIFGFSELLEKGYKDYDEERLLEIISLIKASSENAYNLLENLLQWARTQTDRIKYTPEYFSIHDLTSQVVKLLKPNAESKDIEIRETSVPGIQVFADKNMVNTILRNLISNSIKFTNHNGIIKIRISPSSSKHVEIVIEDNGMGIEEENLDKLFRIDNYFTTPGTSGESGTGLGLIITKEFISKNRGDIFVKSRLGKGTTFTVILPAKDFNA